MEDNHVGTHQQNKDDGCYGIANIYKVEVGQLSTQHNSNHVSSIKKMLSDLHPMTEECSIYRVSKRLHNIHDMAFAPQDISIGPFHHGRKELMAMEQLKLRFLHGYLRRVGMEVKAAFDIAREWEIRARKCYAEPIDMKSEDFVTMMLVDGCFLVELFIMDYEFSGTQTQLSYPLFSAISTDLLHDLIPLENQLPYFILECLFKISDYSCIDCIVGYLGGWYIGAHVLPKVPTREANHLVDLLSFYYAIPTVTISGNNGQEWERPPTATQLKEAGVKFQKATDCKHITDISFQDGVLKIPCFQITTTFETHVRNLLAFEHYYHLGHHKRCLQYFSFLDDLINTEKDVNLLVEAGIISNNIGGNNENIAKLFNDMVKHANITSYIFYYSQISLNLRKYCKTQCHRWMASLRRDYFNTPWTFISFLAATFLILLTVVQTLYSALSYS
ncbi:UPF0481 protein At3g47200-like [Momordica charantia]|uniref:UPF0481 protein At3g47200-like n=1 Tax=Momordica charantia TaxID=3673 RepID=A0A6J1DQT2_MOMCH|nr:UPF0481 protein At3g47200-like [Momordica charantia]